MDLWSDSDAVSCPLRQLLLPFEPPAEKTFETFVQTGNETVLQHVKRLCVASASSRQIYLWGAASAGKSHLLQAACLDAATRGGRSVRLPLAELLLQGPGVLADLGSLDLVGLDGLDAVAASCEWQRPLFNLINEIRAHRGFLLMAGRRNPAGMEFDLRDLSSRLMWGAVYRLIPLDDTGKIEALRRISSCLGCTFAIDALPYLLSNYPRELAGLMEAVERLARVAKERKRRVTVPLIKEVLPPVG